MGNSESKAAKAKPSEEVPFGPDGLKPSNYSTNDRKQHGVPLFVNVYNLQDTPQGGTKPKGSTFNQAMGFGVYHSGIQVLGAEWSFGGNPEAHASQSGIFPVHPRNAMPAHQFYQQVRIGEIVGLTQAKLTAVLRKLEPDWKAVSYHLLNHNCNHFGAALLKGLNEEFNVSPPLEQPGWVNRAARFGDVMVPDRIYKAMMRRTPQPPSGGAGAGAGASVPPQPTSYSTGSSAGAQRPAEPKEEEVPKVPLAKTPEEMKGMSVKQIKTMMWVNGVSWDGCVEKGDLIDAVMKYREAAGLDKDK